MSALVTSQIFRMFFNTLTPDDKYSRRNMQTFWQQLQATLSQKGKTFCRFLIVFLNCGWNLQRSEKPRRVSFSNYDRNYCIRKRCLLKRLKALASAHHSVINVLTGSKHYWSPHGTTIFLFFRKFEINWVGKSLSESHLKSSYCLLTRWLPRTNISVTISRLPDNKFKRLYLKKERIFFRFFIAFLKCAWNLEHSEKKGEYSRLIATEIIASERDVYLSV